LDQRGIKNLISNVAPEPTMHYAMKCNTIEDNDSLFLIPQEVSGFKTDDQNKFCRQTNFGWSNCTYASIV